MRLGGRKHRKNWPKYRVTDWEIEEVSLNVPIAFSFDASRPRTVGSADISS